MQHLTFVRVNYPIYLGLEQITTVMKLYKKRALITITDVATALHCDKTGELDSTQFLKMLGLREIL